MAEVAYAVRIPSLNIFLYEINVRDSIYPFIFLTYIYK